jgi:hypothetical protein
MSFFFVVVELSFLSQIPYGVENAKLHAGIHMDVRNDES